MWVVISNTNTLPEQLLAVVEKVLLDVRKGNASFTQNSSKR